MNKLANAVQDTQPKAKFKFKFYPKDRTWKLHYVGWDAIERDVIFQMEKPILGLSQHLVHEQLHDVMKFGIFKDDDQGIKGPLITTVVCGFPNMWPDRDPHQTFSKQEVAMLYHILMREAHSAFFQRLADGWRNHASEKAHALDFEVDGNLEEE